MAELVKDIFRSSLMSKELPYRVILPDRLRSSEVQYPVLYLLHGLFGNCDNWLDLTGLKKYLPAKEFAVVLPDGGNQWYTDSATVAGDKFETSFINEFIPAVEASFRIGGGREQRAVAGLSMGGFGALKFALKYPDLFVFAGSMSGAFSAPRLTKDSLLLPGTEELLPSVSEVFGEAGSRTRIENDLFAIVGQMPAGKSTALPRLYLDCGTADGLLEVNRELSELLKEKSLNFSFEEHPGGHDWSYWNRRIKIIIEIIDKIFRQNNA